MRTAEDIIGSLVARFTGLEPTSSWGETSLFYNPGRILPRGVYFCTVKDHDGANDRASQLDRPGVFRVALGLPVGRYESLFGPRPARPPQAGVVATGHDFTAIDVVMPHPVYGWMGWIQVLNPSTSTCSDMQPLFAEAYDHAVAKFATSIARSTRPPS